MRAPAQRFEPLQVELPRVGVLGAARIVPKALAQVAGGLLELRAIAARSPGRAEQFAQEHGFAEVEPSYGALIERRDIDLVYVALPAAFHGRWVEQALLAGKHVLCEKPFGLCVEEASRAVGIARSEARLLMEAHHWRYHPLASLVPSWLAELGELQRVELVFQAPVPPGDIRHDPRLGAGVLLDFGCYLVQWQRLVTGDPAPTILRAEAITDGADVDLAVRAQLETAEGILVGLSCDMRPETTFRAVIRVQGAKGRLVFDNPLATSGSSLSLHTASRTARLQGAGASTYRRQAEALVTSLRTGELPLTAGPVIVETQAMLDALVAACGLSPRAVLVNL